MPVTDQTNSGLIMISTPSDEGNYYSVLGEKRDAQGRLVFNTIHVTHMCDNCRMLPMHVAVNCNHWSFLLPPRKSQRKEAESRALYDGKLEDIMRERFAIVCGSGTSVFNEDLVNDSISIKLPVYQVVKSPLVIFIGADPGFHKSDFAMVAFAEFDDGTRLIGLAAYRNAEGYTEQRQQTRQFIDAIRAKTHFRTTPIVFIPEAAPAQEGTHLASHVSEHYPNLIVMSEANGRPGVPITHDTKRSLIFSMQAVLSRRSLRAITQMVACTNKSPMKVNEFEHATANDYLISLMAAQLKSFHARVKSGIQGVDERVYYTGKGYGTNDDLAMAAMTAFYWSTQFLVSTNPKYTAFKQKLMMTR